MSEVEVIYQKQKEYSYVKEINIFREIYGDECSQYNVKISLVTFPCWDTEEKFDIIFEYVNDIKIGEINNLFRVCIQIESLTDFQLEDARYVVKEIENELFSFTCKNIII